MPRYVPGGECYRLATGEDCHADNARLALSAVSDAALANLTGACLREIQRRAWQRMDNAKLADVQTLIDNWE